MKKNTWVIVAIALAITASMVIAKSIFTTIGHAQAATDTTIAAPQWSSPTPQPAVQTEAVPLLAKATLKKPDAEGEQVPWTVLVVRGDKIEKVVYPSADTKAHLPALKE